MREVIIQAWCDGWMRVHGTQTEANSAVTVSVGEVKRVLDLCENCAAAAANFMIHLRENGTKVEGSKDPESVAARTCPECQKVSANRQALSSHLRERHSKGLRDYPREIFGL